MRKFFIPVLAAAILALPAGPAAAETATTTVVSFADLDIATPEGRLTLEERIADAVTEVCGRPSRRSSFVNDTIHHCRTDALADAMAQLEERLAALPVEIAAAD